MAIVPIISIYQLCTAPAAISLREMAISGRLVWAGHFGSARALFLREIGRFLNPDGLGAIARGAGEGRTLSAEQDSRCPGPSIHSRLSLSRRGQAYSSDDVAIGCKPVQQQPRSERDRKTAKRRMTIGRRLA
jgi:hypothetical protein